MKYNKIIALIIIFATLITSTICNASETTYDYECAVVDVQYGNGKTDQYNQKTVVEIYHLLHAWRSAIKDSNAKKVASLVTEAAEFWPNGASPLKGRAALEEAFRPFLAEYKFSQDYECYELTIRGDIAFIRGLERNTKIPRKGGDTITTRQRAFSVIRQSKDGRWLFSRGMTNLPAK